MILEYEVIEGQVIVHIDVAWTPSSFKEACREWDKLAAMYQAEYFFVYIVKDRKWAAERWGFKTITYINTGDDVLALMSRPVRDIRKTRNICYP